VRRWSIGFDLGLGQPAPHQAVYEHGGRHGDVHLRPAQPAQDGHAAPGYGTASRRSTTGCHAVHWSAPCSLLRCGGWLVVDRHAGCMADFRPSDLGADLCGHADQRPRPPAACRRCVVGPSMLVGWPWTRPPWSLERSGTIFSTRLRSQLRFSNPLRRSGRRLGRYSPSTATRLGTMPVSEAVNAYMGVQLSGAGVATGPSRRMMAVYGGEYYRLFLRTA
jgi:hypothetical protein